MSQPVRSIIVAGYLLLCIFLGGSAQGIWRTLALQLLGIALIAWAALAAEPSDENTDAPNFVHALLGFGMLLVLLQLIPLPPEMWAELPGRSELADGLAQLGAQLPALPLSVTPYRSVATLFAIIPGLALFISATLLRPSPLWIAFAIVVGTLCSIALGALQVAGGPESAAYLYKYTNPRAVGVFANSNHMGLLLLISIPFGTALLVSWTARRGGSAQGRWVVGVAGLVLVMVGIALNGSHAALGLALPVLLASAALAPAGVRWRGIAPLLAGVAVIGGVALLATSPLATPVTAESVGQSVQPRLEIWNTTFQAIRDTFPAGTGLGSFEQIYRLYEDPAGVTLYYVNHAHNDYLELVLELGAPGLLLILLFLGWWAFAAFTVWTSPLSSVFGRAATIASAAILAHSVVDYPLRTSAIAAIFGVSIALMVQYLRSVQAASGAERRPPRHIKLG